MRQDSAHPARAHHAADANPAEQNIRAVARIEEKARSKRSIATCVSDGITEAAGSEWSVLFHLVWFSVWLVVNTGLTPIKAFDPFPFSLLTSIVSLEAIFLTLFVLASQNHMTREADKRAHLDLQVNLLAEQEMTVVLHMLKEICEHLNLTETTRSEEFQALLKHTDVKNLSDRLEKLIPTVQAPSSKSSSSKTSLSKSAVSKSGGAKAHSSEEDTSDSEPDAPATS